MSRAEVAALGIDHEQDASGHLHMAVNTSDEPVALALLPHAKTGPIKLQQVAPIELDIKDDHVVSISVSWRLSEVQLTTAKAKLQRQTTLDEGQRLLGCNAPSVVLGSSNASCPEGGTVSASAASGAYVLGRGWLFETGGEHPYAAPVYNLNAALPPPVNKTR